MSYTLIESRSRRLPLTGAEATKLRELGRRLASDSRFWGDDQESARSVVQCRVRDDGTYDVSIDNAIGAVAVGDLSLIVRPKIPFSHFLMLAEKSGRMPRVDPAIASVREGASFWHLVARTFVSVAESVLDRDLAKDYVERSGPQPFLRGRLHLLPTVMQWHTRASAEVVCSFEDYEADTPLNRLLKEAALRVAASSLLSWEVRRRGLTIVDRMDGVGPYMESDFGVCTDRRTRYYDDAVALARNVIRGVGRLPQAGSANVSSFLLPTPRVVEDGIRAMLHSAMSVETRPWPHGRSKSLRGAGMTINPDLLFARQANAVGDVKYKLCDGSWNRADLYQSVAFAVGFGVSRSVIVGFSRSAPLPIESVVVGDRTVHQVLWRVSRRAQPEESAAAVVEQVEGILATRLNLPDTDPRTQVA